MLFANWLNSGINFSVPEGKARDQTHFINTVSLNRVVDKGWDELSVHIPQSYDSMKQFHVAS